MGPVGRQFAHPSGLVGAIVGRLMARGNGPFNEAVMTAIAAEQPNAVEVAELGCGPGVGLSALLAEFPEAHVTGVDQSSRMLGQSRLRNQRAERAGRLAVRQGGAADLGGPYDVVVAVHVLYFWPDLTAALTQVRSALRVGGLLALGYRLRHEMPAAAQRDFPSEGHTLYDHEDTVLGALTSAGFTDAASRPLRNAESYLGRLATGRT